MICWFIELTSSIVCSLGNGTNTVLGYILKDTIGDNHIGYPQTQWWCRHSVYLLHHPWLPRLHRIHNLTQECLHQTHVTWWSCSVQQLRMSRTAHLQIIICCVHADIWHQRMSILFEAWLWFCRLHCGISQGRFWNNMYCLCLQHVVINEVHYRHHLVIYHTFGAVFSVTWKSILNGIRWYITGLGFVCSEHRMFPDGGGK